MGHYGLIDQGSLLLANESGLQVSQYSQIYMREIVRLHGAPLSIVSDRDPKFTSGF